MGLSKLGHMFGLSIVINFNPGLRLAASQFWAIFLLNIFVH